MIFGKIYRKITGRTYPYRRLQSDLRDFSSNYPINTYNYERIDVALLTLNRLEDTKRTLSSLYKTTVPFNLIIIDQGSDDGTIEFLENFENLKENVKFIKLKENIGVSGGRALSVNHAEHQYLAFIDNDMVFSPGYFEHLVQKLDKNDEYVGLFAKVVLPNSLIEVNTPTLQENDNWCIFSDKDRNKLFDDPSTFEEVKCKWIPMGASLWRTSILKKFKLDTDVLGAYEDNEYTYRLYKQGYSFANCPQSIVLHIKAQFTKFSVDKNYSAGRFDIEKLRKSMRKFYVNHGKYLAFGDIQGHLKYLGFQTEEEYIKYLKS